MTSRSQPSSASLSQPEYWWYRARSDLLRTVLERYLDGADRLLDVGSADGPSVAWMRRPGHYRIALDVDMKALGPGDVCASALALPFRADSFDVVTALDVIEHCEPEERVLSELLRVLRPDGRLLLAVPAYQWAWSEFDVHAGHHRRYTRRRLVRAVEAAGATVERATYIFAGTLPLFAVERIGRKLRRRAEAPGSLPEVSPAAERVLMALCRMDRWFLARRDLPFGSSVVLAATKPRRRTTAA